MVMLFRGQSTAYGLKRFVNEKLSFAPLCVIYTQKRCIHLHKTVPRAALRYEKWLRCFLRRYRFRSGDLIHTEGKDSSPNIIKMNNNILPPSISSLPKWFLQKSMSSIRQHLYSVTRQMSSIRMAPRPPASSTVYISSASKPKHRVEQGWGVKNREE